MFKKKLIVNNESEFKGVEIDKEQIDLMNVLTNSQVLTSLSRKELVKSGILDKNVNEESKITRYVISKKLCDKFLKNPKELKNLLELLPYYYEMLEYIISPNYSYDILINKIIPNFNYVEKMKSAGYTNDQILFLVSNDIFLDYYDKEFDYDEIQMLLTEYNIHCNTNIFLLNYEVVKQILIYFPSCNIDNIIKEISECNIALINKWIPIMIKHKFYFDEITMFLELLYNMSNSQKIQSELFLKYSTKEELFKKIIEMKIK